MQIHVTNRRHGDREISLDLTFDASKQLHELLKEIHVQCRAKGQSTPIQFQFSPSGSDFEYLTSLTYNDLRKSLGELFEREKIELTVLMLTPIHKQENLSQKVVDAYFSASTASKTQPNKNMRQQYLKSRIPAVNRLNSLYSFFQMPILAIIHEYWGSSNFLVIDVPPLGDIKTSEGVIATFGSFITNAFDVHFSENDVHHLLITTSVLLNHSSRSDFHDSLSLAKQHLADRSATNNAKSLQLVLHLNYNNELLGIYSNQYSFSKGGFEETLQYIPCSNLYSTVTFGRKDYLDQLKKSFVQYVLDNMIADDISFSLFRSNPAKLKLCNPYYKWVRSYFLDNQTLSKFKNTDTLEDIITLAIDEAGEARQMILSYLKKDAHWFARQQPHKIKAALIQKTEIEFDLIQNEVEQLSSPKLG